MEIPERLFEIISSQKIRLNEAHLLTIIYADDKIKNHDDFSLLITCISRSFKHDSSADFWVQLGTLRTKKKLPGRTVQGRFVCAHDNALKNLFQGPPFLEANMRRLFGYSRRYNLKNLISDLYILETGEPDQVEKLKQKIAMRYYAPNWNDSTNE